MIRLLVLIAVLLYGLFAAFDFMQRTRTLGMVRAAVKAYGKYDLEKVDRELARIRREGSNATGALGKLMRDEKLDLIERQFAQRAVASFASDAKHKDLAQSTALEELASMDLAVNTEDRDVDTLARYLGAKDPAFRIAAARALGDRGDKVGGEVKEALIERLSEDRFQPVAAAAAEALGKLGVTKAATLLAETARDDPGQLGESCTRALARLGGAAARGHLEKLLATHPVAAAQGLEALGDRGAADSLAKLLKQDDDAARLAAARALVVLGDSRGIEALLKAIRSGLEEDRARALRAAGGLEEPEVVEAIVAVANATQKELRVAAASALARTPGALAVATLKALMTDGERDVRVATMRAIGERKAPELQAFVRDHLDDKDDRVREAAIVAAVGTRDMNVVGTLREVFHSATLQPGYVRRAAWVGLKALTGKAPEISDDEKGIFKPKKRDPGL